MPAGRRRTPPVVDLSEAPARPGIYAMHDGNLGDRPVAYVGQATKLRNRLRQHLILRESSMTTGVSLACLRPDLVRAVEWWGDARFTDEAVLGAAELVAFEVLDQILRSRGQPTAKARTLFADPKVKETWRQVFLGPPSGTLTIDTLPGLAARVRELETRVETLEGEAARGRRRG